MKFTRMWWLMWPLWISCHQPDGKTPETLDPFAEAIASYRLRSDDLDRTYTQLLKSVQWEAILRECRAPKPDVRIGEGWDRRPTLISDELIELAKQYCPSRRDTDREIKKIASETYRYRPVTAMILAGFETMKYRGDWVTTPLSSAGLLPSEKYYDNPVVTYVRVNPRQKRTFFILINGSFSSHPLWHSKLRYLLDEEFSTPHLMSLSGFLSPEFLSFHASMPPLSSHKEAGWVDTYTTFESYTDMHERLRAITAPFTVVFAQDDSVLADPDFATTRRLPPRVKEILDFVEGLAQTRKNFRIFLPEVGGHHAYFLDTRFLRKLLSASFSKNIDTLQF